MGETISYTGQGYVGYPLSMTATKTSNFWFSRWEVNGTQVSSSLTYNYTLTEADGDRASIAFKAVYAFGVRVYAVTTLANGSLLKSSASVSANIN